MIKNWINFINESKLSDVDISYIWDHDEDFFKDVLKNTHEFSDLSIDLGFYHGKKQPLKVKPLIGKDCYPGYTIGIKNPKKPFDISNELLDLVEYFDITHHVEINFFKVAQTLQDVKSNKLKDLKIRMGFDRYKIFLKEENAYNDLRIVHIHISERDNTVNLTPIQLAKYYGWEPDFIKGDDVYTKITLHEIVMENTVSTFVENLLFENIDALLVDYDKSNYSIKTSDVIKLLSEENKIKFLNKIFNEMGYEEIMDKLKKDLDVINIEINSKKEAMNLIKSNEMHLFETLILHILDDSTYKLYVSIREKLRKIMLIRNIKININEIKYLFDKGLKEIFGDYIKQNTKQVDIEFGLKNNIYYIPLTNKIIPTYFNPEQLKNSTLEYLVKSKIGSHSNLKINTDALTSPAVFSIEHLTNDDIKLFNSKVSKMI